MTTQAFAYTPGPQGEFAHRPIVWGTRGMVGGGTQLTAQTGMRILWQGCDMKSSQSLLCVA